MKRLADARLGDNRSGRGVQESDPIDAGWNRSLLAKQAQDGRKGISAAWGSRHRGVVDGKRNHHVLAMERGRPGQRYNFSSQFLTVDDLLGIFEQVTGQPRPRLRLPGALMQGVAALSDLVLRWFPRVPRRFTPGAVRLLRMQRRANCQKARDELGYQPTLIADAVREAYECFVRRGLIHRLSDAAVTQPVKSPSSGTAAS